MIPSSAVKATLNFIGNTLTDNVADVEVRDNLCMCLAVLIKNTVLAVVEPKTQYELNELDNFILEVGQEILRYQSQVSN
jgi:hypothetical protein